MRLNERLYHAFKKRKTMCKCTINDAQNEKGERFKECTIIQFQIFLQSYKHHVTSSLYLSFCALLIGSCNKIFSYQYMLKKTLPNVGLLVV